jgi:hypothetical protein
VGDLGVVDFSFFLTSESPFLDSGKTQSSKFKVQGLKFKIKKASAKIPRSDGLTGLAGLADCIFFIFQCPEKKRKVQDSRLKTILRFHKNLGACKKH